MAISLQRRIAALVRSVLDTYPGAWLVWCDPRDDWGPLLQRVAGDARLGGFSLISVPDRTSGELGGPIARAALQARLETGESFVLHVRAGADDLGWLWASALLAERIYARSLRDQLVEWGWRPHDLTLTDDAVAMLARRGMQQDPADWGAAGLAPEPDTLLEVLAGAAPDPDLQLIVDLTLEATDLPPLDLGNLPRWRTRCLARLLVTQAHAVAPGLVADAHELLVQGAPRRAAALELLDRWRDSRRLSQPLPEAILAADRIAALGAVLTEVSAAHGPFVSHAAEAAAFAATCRRLGQLDGRDLLQQLAASGDAVERHVRGFWGDDCPHRQAVPWGELRRLSRAAATALDAAAGATWNNMGGAYHWYADDGWRLDAAGEEIMRDLAATTPELLAIIGPLRAAYRALWEGTLIAWSEVSGASEYVLPSLPTAGEWLAEAALPLTRPTAVVYVDALRYDLGAALAEAINQREGAERAQVRSARAPLPSITALGMGLALPIAERTVRADLDGKTWRLLADDGRDLSIAAERRAWWRDNHAVAEDAFLSMAQVEAGQVAGPTADRRLLIVTDALLDKLGHDDELESLGSGAARERYLSAISRLRDAGWTRIFVVTDHGFLHWASGEERAVPPPAPDPAYASRRALAYPPGVRFDGPQALAPGGQWRIAVPHGAASFRAYGGLGFFHGGASLQEWVIPCLQIEWPLAARPVSVGIQPLTAILSQRARVTLLVERDTLFLEDFIPRQVEVLVRHAETRAILFRSAPTVIMPSQTQVEVPVQAVDGVAAERGNALSIDVRDSSTDEIIATTDSQLQIELTGW
ncbi:MAG: PglZ domain-containing protein [Chloroflexi bacterium]|nr:PglZ domain-containing protein [Chloroflexota bacterium]